MQNARADSVLRRVAVLRKAVEKTDAVSKSARYHYL